MRVINLNLSPKYCETWGAWEVAREFICNAMDADPAGYTVGYDQAKSKLTVETSTKPELAEMFVIGHGSKTIGGNTIGQFGEGSKIAALAATRNGSVVFRTSSERVRFEMRDSELGIDTLHAIIEQNAEEIPGLIVEISMPGIVKASKDKFLDPGVPTSAWAKRNSQGSLYCKGVWIQDHPGLHFSWNINSASINRDRSNMTLLGLDLACNAHVLSKDQWLEMMEIPECEEFSMLRYSLSNIVTRTVVQAFETRYGEKAILKTIDDKANKAAKDAGYTVIGLRSQALMQFLADAGVPTSNCVTKPDGSPIPVQITPKMAEKIAMLRRLDETMAAPAISVYVMENLAANSEMGYADTGENRMWLNKDLFLDGRELDLIMTYVHEMCHFITGEADETRAFEFGLSRIAGVFAQAWMNGNEQVREAA